MEIEKFLPESYLKNNMLELPEGINRIKIDIGLSFNAPVSFEWLEKDPKLVVFGFEPNVENIKIIKEENEKLNPFSGLPQYKMNSIRKYINKRFFIFPFALSNYTGHATFYNIINKINNQTKKLDYDSGSSSLLEPFEMDYNKSETKVFKLEDFLSQINWKKIPFINQVKIDAQGEDFKIIYGMGKYIKKIGTISYEMNAPGYKGYNNYKFKNLKMFIYLYIKGFRYLKKTSSDIVFKNKRLKLSEESILIVGT